MPEAPGNILPEWSSDCLHFSSDGELTTHKVPPHSIFGILLRLSCYLTPWASHWAHPALWVVSLAHEKLFCNWNTTTAAPTTTITPTLLAKLFLISSTTANCPPPSLLPTQSCQQLHIKQHKDISIWMSHKHLRFGISKAVSLIPWKPPLYLVCLNIPHPTPKLGHHFILPFTLCIV